MWWTLWISTYHQFVSRPSFNWKWSAILANWKNNREYVLIFQAQSMFTVHKMMPLTATRHPAVLFLSGINVTTPSAPIIGGAHWLIVHLLIARRCYFLITIKTAFPSWMISVLPYYSQYLSKVESDISQLSCHLPPETKKAVLTNHIHMCLPILQVHFHWLPLYTFRPLSSVGIQGL